MVPYAYGIFAHSGGAIVANENLSIQVNSTTDAVGIYSLSYGEIRSEVQLNGATITATGTNNSYVMVADGGRIISQLDSNGDPISTSKFLLKGGNMAADNGGLIDLVLGAGSEFVGSANENTGSIKLKMEADSNGM